MPFPEGDGEGATRLGGARRAGSGRDRDRRLAHALAAEDPERYAALAAVLALMVGGFLLLGYLLRAGIVTRPAALIVLVLATLTVVAFGVDRPTAGGLEP